MGVMVAVLRDDRKPVLLKEGTTLGKPRVWIYTCSGILLQSITVRFPLCIPVVRRADGAKEDSGTILLVL